MVTVGFAFACSGKPLPHWNSDEAEPGIGASPASSSSSTPPGSNPVRGGGTSEPASPPPSSTEPGQSSPPSTNPSPNPSAGEGNYEPVFNPDGSVARPMELTGTPFETRFARLTNEQWQRAVRDLLHLPELPIQESQFFENIGAGATDFVNDQSRLQMSNTQWQQFQAAAEALAKRVSESDAAMQSVSQANDAETFVREFGLRAFRRPLRDDEVARYLDVFDVGAQLSGAQSEFTKGAALVIEAMLQSPNFLYRTEVGAAGTPLNGYERAAKLSLYLLRTIPSEELLAKAGRGELDSVEGLVNEARAMLETDEAAETFSAFHTELYELRRFSEIQKSDPTFTPAVGSELVEASQAFFDRIYREGHGLHEILTTRSAFVGPATAPLYGLDQAPSSLSEVQLPEERAGFFTQLPYLMYFARDMQSYGITRGVHINTEVLCAKLPELDVPAPPLPEVEYITSREYMEKGTVCGGACHSEYINPLGFSMENFDGMGRTRALDNGAPVDTSGAYPFVGGREPFQDAVDLMKIIADNEMAHQCYSRYVASYGLGRMLGADDVDLVETLATMSLESKASTKELVLALVSSPEFNTREGAN